MFERAKFYKKELTTNDKEDILELEPTGIVCNFDSEDLQNHNFDMGKMRLAKEILHILK